MPMDSWIGLVGEHMITTHSDIGGSYLGSYAQVGVVAGRKGAGGAGAAAVCRDRGAAVWPGGELGAARGGGGAAAGGCGCRALSGAAAARSERGGVERGAARDGALLVDRGLGAELGHVSRRCTWSKDEPADSLGGEPGAGAAGAAGGAGSL